MSILIDETTPVLVQGMTGDKGTFHTKEMIAYGTNVVGGVTPGKGGGNHLGLPLFNTVKEAVKQTGATTSHHLRGAGLLRRRHHGSGRCRHQADLLDHRRHPGAGHDAGEALSDALSQRPPSDDGRAELRRHHQPRQGHARHHARPHLSAGPVGVISRSGTLGYEAASQMKAKGIGITTSVGIGGDPINGSSFLDHLALFEEDPETDAVLMIGEIGGPQEAEASAWIKDNMSKPVIGFVAGLTAPKGRRMGHAGAIISAAGDSAAEKAEIMRSCGLTVAPNPSEFGSTVAGVLAKRPERRAFA